MKYIKKFENTDYSEYESDISDIKDILISLKDDYLDISFEFFPWTSLDGKIKGLKLLIDTCNILPKGQNANQHEKYSIEYSNLKLNLIKKILETLERIEKSINKECKVINIWDCNDSVNKIQINIVSRS